MKSRLLCLFLIFISKTIIAQNLVNNPSFEQFIICPSGINKPPPPPWYMPCKKGAIYCNACANDNIAGVPVNAVGSSSFQYPRTGNAYIFLDFLNGVGNNERSYVQAPLKDSMVAGKCYYGEYYINLPNPLKIGSNNIAMLFTKNKVYVDTVTTPWGILPANPQIVNFSNPIMGDTLLWQKVSGVFVAEGGEKYLTLGNFKYDNETQFAAIQATGQNKVGYYIDDVAVYPLDSIILKADAGQDKNITLGDSTFIGSYTNGLTGVRWFNNLGQEITAKAGIPGFFVKPLVSTFYVIEQNVCGQYSRDTVNVTVGAMPLKFMSLTLNPSPTKRDLIHINWQTSNEINVSHFNIKRSINGIDFETIGKLTAKNGTINDYFFVLNSPPLPGLGVVYYRVVGVDFDGKKTYSPTKTLNHKPQTLNFDIYPNPAKDYINIYSNQKIKEIRIFDNYGRQVQIALGTNTRNNMQMIYLNNLAKGLYIVNIITQKGEAYNEKVLIH